MDIRQNKRGFFERVPNHDTLKVILVTLVIANIILIRLILGAVL